jgi:hypothetical protein
MEVLRAHNVDGERERKSFGLLPCLQHVSHAAFPHDTLSLQSNIMTVKEEDPPTETGKAKEKVPVATIKRPTKKKPKDTPKRPLSAYNFFFKEERGKILKVVLAEESDKVENEPDSEDYLDDEALGRLRKEGGKVSFEEMGKLIGQRWKSINPDRLAGFTELAAEDTERYKKEMTLYNGRQEAKMRSEALKPPITFPAASAGGAKADGTAARGGYPEGMGSAFGAAGMQYPYGMDFSAYPGMSGMYYGGYPGMGGGGAGMGGGGGSSEGMGQQMQQQPGGMDPQQYARNASAMYGMMGGGFQGGMMGYGGQGQGGQQGAGGQGQGQGGEGNYQSQQAMDAHQQAMYQQYGQQQGGQGWGGQ